MLCNVKAAITIHNIQIIFKWDPHITCPLAGSYLAHRAYFAGNKIETHIGGNLFEEADQVASVGHHLQTGRVFTLELKARVYSDAMAQREAVQFCDSAQRAADKATAEKS